MLKKILKVSEINRENLILIQGNFFNKYGFKIGDLISINIEKDKILIEKSRETLLATKMSNKNTILLKMIKDFNLTV